MPGSARRRIARARPAARVAVAGCLLALVACSAARADGYGELGRFAVVKSGLQLSEGTSAFGVDPTDNDVYVGEEVPSTTPGEPSGRYHILRYSSSGTLLAESRALNPKSKFALGIEGIAVDPADRRVYVLGLFERSAGEKLIDAEEAAAGTLYALNSATLASEVLGTGKKEEEGVLASPEVLRADGKAAGEALLNPRGIAVDPTTRDVVMLGEVDTGTLATPQRHLALERVSSAGALLPGRYVDPNVEQEPEADSPVVTAAGDVLAERTSAENLEQIIEFPRGAGSTAQPSVVFEFPAKPFGPDHESTSLEELLEASAEAPEKGAGLALASEGATAGVLYSDAQVEEQTPQGSEFEVLNGFPGVLLINTQDTAGTVTTSERGWTGGANPLANPHAACAIAEREFTYPLLGAGSEGRLFVLDPATAQVIEFGPGGEGCPHPSAPAVPAIELTDASGLPIAEAPVGGEVTLSSPVLQGNVVSTEWSFGDGTPPVVSTAGEYQRTEAQHTFSAVGTYTVIEKIETDDLAAPKLTVQGTVSVKYATTTSALLSGEGSSGATVTVKEGASVTDQATVEGAHAATATGTVEYRIYSDSACSNLVESAGSASVNGGSGGVSEAKKLASGSHYWQASYSGDATNMASTSACAAEVVQGPTTTTALLSGEGSSGVTLTVTEGASVSDKATVEGVNAAIATGTVEYKIYSDSACSNLVESAGSASVNGGSGGASAARKLAAGTHYWQASYSGDAANRPSTSACAAEIVHAPAPAPAPSTPSAGGGGGTTQTATAPAGSPPAAPQAGLVGVLSYRAGLATTTFTVSASGSVVIKVACLGTSSCAGTLTLRTLGAVSAGAGKRKAVLTLAVSSFALRGGQSKALTLHLTAPARKLLARAHVLRARAVIKAKDASGVVHVTALVVTLRAAKPHH
jgi:hypothetical protein